VTRIPRISAPGTGGRGRIGVVTHGGCSGRLAAATDCICTMCAASAVISWRRSFLPGCCPMKNGRSPSSNGSSTGRWRWANRWPPSGPPGLVSRCRAGSGAALGDGGAGASSNGRPNGPAMGDSRLNPAHRDAARHVPRVGLGLAVPRLGDPGVGRGSFVRRRRPFFVRDTARGNHFSLHSAIGRDEEVLNPEIAAHHRSVLDGLLPPRWLEFERSNSTACRGVNKHYCVNGQECATELHKELMIGSHKLLALQL